MSWNVALVCPHCRRPVTVDLQAEGATVRVGGSDSAEFSITYNYGAHFRDVYEVGIAAKFDRRQAAECIPELERGVTELGDDPSEDYWQPTRGNAGHALAVMLRWAKCNPDAVWQIT